MFSICNTEPFDKAEQEVVWSLPSCFTGFSFQGFFSETGRRAEQLLTVTELQTQQQFDPSEVETDEGRFLGKLQDFRGFLHVTQTRPAGLVLMDPSASARPDGSFPVQTRRTPSGFILQIQPKAGLFSPNLKNAGLYSCRSTNPASSRSAVPLVHMCLRAGVHSGHLKRNKLPVCKPAQNQAAVMRNWIFLCL